MVSVYASETAPRGFLNAPERFTRAEAAYLTKFALSPLNPLRYNGRVMFIMARGEERGYTRLITYTDEYLSAARGERAGFFALLGGEYDPETARAALNCALDTQREWGNDKLIGPVSPDGSGLFHGLALESAGSLSAYESRNDPRMHGALIEFGFAPCGKALAFDVRVPAENPLAPLAARARARFNTAARTVRLSSLREGDEAAIHALSPNARALKLSDTTRQLSRLLPMLARGHSFIAFRDGEPQGFLLSIKLGGSRVRALTLMTHAGRFSQPATLILLSALCDSLIRAGVKRVVASQIEADNLPSLMCVNRFDAARIGAFMRYSKNVNEI